MTPNERAERWFERLMTLPLDEAGYRAALSNPASSVRALANSIDAAITQAVAAERERAIDIVRYSSCCDGYMIREIVAALRADAEAG